MLISIVNVTVRVKVNKVMINELMERQAHQSVIINESQFLNSKYGLQFPS